MYVCMYIFVHAYLHINKSILCWAPGPCRYASRIQAVSQWIGITYANRHTNIKKGDCIAARNYIPD